MSRLLFASGAKGDIVRRMQRKLSDLGFYTKPIDGDYGNGTKTAVLAFQESKGLPQNGQIDTDTWTALMNADIPAVDERCLGLTSTFEGHGYTLAQGNFDGAGITWGIIGFTLKHGELTKIIKQAFAEDPELVRSCFGDKADELLTNLDKPVDEQIAWADSISEGTTKARLAEPWKSAFAKFGDTPLAQRLQRERVVTSYYEPARATAARFGLKSELGTALCFDIHVQNGGIKEAAAAQVRAQITADTPEKDIRIAIANAVADNALERWRDDVRQRKLAIAQGEGSVHGAPAFVLRNWGLDEFDA
ncbi:MAG TPA: peptidoglycan-binding protein [Thermoanaerobaculia bacterium]|nr:peptidoglycan-binding protein [Thermoanaerobaculia bacterium]